MSPARRRLAVAAILLLFADRGTADAREAKVVYYGWGAPSWMFVSRNTDAVESMPFDGTGIIIPIDRDAWERGHEDTSNRLGWRLFGAQRFTAPEFADAMAELGAVRWRRFTDNFLVAAINSKLQSKDFSWFDDDRWRTIEGNWSLFLKIARRARAKGIILDPEDYGAGLFDYHAMAAIRPGSFADYQALARRRGRELMRASRRVFPALVILALYGPSLPLDPTSDAALAKSEYALYPAFVAGLLEGADPSVRFIDGCEFSYAYDRPEQFEAMRKTMADRAARRRVAQESSGGKLEYGFGLWIDYGGVKRWFAEQPWRNHFSPDRFERALTAAMRSTDEYVWIYSHGARFFPPSSLPNDYLEAMRRARAVVSASR